MREFIHLYLTPDHCVRDAMESGPESVVGGWGTNSSGEDIHIFINEGSRKNMIHHIYDRSEPPPPKVSNEGLIAQALIKGDRIKAKELGATDEQIDRWLSWIEEKRKSQEADETVVTSD